MSALRDRPAVCLIGVAVISTHLPEGLSSAN
jgi:hypothetical protein